MFHILNYKVIKCNATLYFYYLSSSHFVSVINLIYRVMIKKKKKSVYTVKSQVLSSSAQQNVEKEYRNEQWLVEQTLVPLSRTRLVCIRSNHQTASCAMAKTVFRKLAGTLESGAWYETLIIFIYHTLLVCMDLWFSSFKM